MIGDLFVACFISTQAQHCNTVTSTSAGVSAGLAGELTEQLRLLLEPTRASRLAGDFRTGKRISMRKVVAYVASHFRKDKIWLRRTKPDKRQYQVGSYSVISSWCQPGLFRD